jgi:predicted nucleic acid-binding protein
MLDAGPLIALSYPADRDHPAARRGFQQLLAWKSRLFVPLPIVFEVTKWLLHQANGGAAQAALGHMRGALEIVFPSEADFDNVTALVTGLGPRWRGSLEDALVAALAIRFDLPVWTLNYRDLGAFPRLRVWNP